MTSAAATAEPCRSRVIARKYRLDSLLGEGGMGSVWRAFNLQLEAPVAIKLLRPEVDNGELGERLRVEARAAAKLVHPHIVRVFDVDESEQGEPFIVMELLDGDSLRAALDRGPLPAVNALQLLLPVAEALSLAHSRGVVHRDFKPDNVLLARVGDTVQPKLLDFGIAKVTSTAAVGGATITCAGTVLGSPEYMSPEQAMGSSDIDHRSDVWSFCVVLYETLCGRSPFTGEGTQEILRAVLQDEPIPLELMVDVDPKLAALIASGLAKAPDARPQSMFELGQALASWLLEHGTQEDVTGAALDYKWLGRSGETFELTRGQGSCEPHVQHDEATLVSVVHPGPPPGAFSTPRLDKPRKVRRAWAASAAVAAAALVGCVSWAAFQQPALVIAASGAQRVEVVEAAPPPVLATIPTDIPAPPLLAAAAPSLESPATEPDRSKLAAVSANRPARAHASRRAPARAGATSLAPAVREPVGALPRALPPQPKARRSRDGSPDLLNPY